MPFAVILSAAKDLHLLVFEEKLRMLRSAQHDTWPFSAASKAPPFPTERVAQRRNHSCHTKTSASRPKDRWRSLR